MINQMCPNRETLKYIKECARYDNEAYSMLNKFLKKGKIFHQFEQTDKTLMKNICYLNKTRIDVNTQCCKDFCKDKQHYKVNFNYNNKKESYIVCKDMPLIATSNIKDKEIYNTMQFKIEDIKEEGKTTLYYINDIWFNQKELEENFIPSFCVTVYKYQGASIDEPYNIYDTSRMDKKQLYTALSRTTKIEYIRLNNNDLNSVYKIRKQPDIELINSRFNSLYKNGKIYLVSFNNEKKYIGSTCEDIQTRLKWHLTNKNSQVYKLKNYVPRIELLVNCPCDSKRSLEKVETKYIEEYAKKYSDQLINIRMNPNKKIKEIKYKVEIDNERDLRARIAQLEGKIKIKDNTKDKYMYFDCNINKKRYRTIAKYNEKPKEDASEKNKSRKAKADKETNNRFLRALAYIHIKEKIFSIIYIMEIPIPTEQIKNGNKIIFINKSTYKGWDDYDIKKHSRLLINASKDDELEYIMIKRKKFLIILDNEISNNENELTEVTKDINN